LLLALALPLGAMQEPEGAPVDAAQPVSYATERFEQLSKEYDAAYQDWMKEAMALYQAAEESGEELTEWPEDPSGSFFPKFMTAAKEFAGTDDAIQFLLWVVENGAYSDSEEVKQAFDTICSSHLASKKLKGFGPHLTELQNFYPDGRHVAILAKIEKVTPSDSVRAWAVFARHYDTLTEADVKSEAYLSAKAELLKHLEKASDDQLAMTYRYDVEVRETFGIGLMAPDIEGIDLDGVAFKLSDYRGKVIFLDFWGDW
jgi:hypothetical protein